VPTHPAAEKVLYYQAKQRRCYFRRKSWQFLSLLSSIQFLIKNRKTVDDFAKYESFEEMVRKSNFISDKSMFIREFAEGHLLFWLPPGRGKTMLLVGNEIGN